MFIRTPITPFAFNVKAKNCRANTDCPSGQLFTWSPHIPVYDPASEFTRLDLLVARQGLQEKP